MQLKIDTIRKVITIIGETPILDVLKFLEGKDLSEWKIESENKTEWVPYTPSPNPYILKREPYPYWLYDPNGQPVYVTETQITCDPSEDKFETYYHNKFTKGPSLVVKPI